jgi:imidazolonepropionase-like amidohydrolase
VKKVEKVEKVAKVENMILLKHCRLIQALTDNWVGESADLLVEKDRIKSIEKHIDFLTDIETIDMRGRWVIPGLIDLHTHLDCAGIEFAEENLLSDADRALKSAYFAKSSLEAGFTTIRDCGARNLNDISLRNAIDKGYLPGPRLVVSGRVLTPTAIGNDELPGEYREADGCEDVRRAVREQVAAGADFIKYMGTGALGHYGSKPGASTYTLEEVKAMVTEADRHGKHVAAHAHGAEGIKYAIWAGVRTIEHASMMDDECLELLKAGTSFIVPTLSAGAVLLEGEGIQGRKAESIRRKSRERFETTLHTIGRAYKLGLKIGFGTDKGTSFNFHGSNYDELRRRRQYLGMEPLDLLLQATRYSAEIIRIDQETGSIAEGKSADLIAVDADPLDDIDVLCRNPGFVMRGGHVVTNRE